jgi:hypothetical protein
MTISTTNTRNDYTGNGATVTFPYTFKVFANTELRVLVDGVLQTLTTHYTVTGVGDDAGGNVVFGTAPANGATVAVLATIALTQTTDLVNETGFFQDRMEDRFDRLCRADQLAAEELSRALTLPEDEAGSSITTTLPSLDDRKGKTLAFDATTGQPVTMATSSAAISAAMQPVVQAATTTLAGNLFETTATGSTTPRSLSDRFAEVVNVKDHGAVGDGVTDDSAAIEAAWAAAPSSHFEILFPPGSYRIIDGATLSGKSHFRVRMIGAIRPEGPTLVLGTKAAIMIEDCTHWYFQSHFEVATANAQGTCLQLSNCQDWSVNDGVLSLSDSVLVKSCPWLVLLDNCSRGVIANNCGSASWGVLSEDEPGVHDITITGNNLRGALDVASGDLIEFNHPTNRAYNITVTGNVFSDTGSTSTYVSTSCIAVGFANCHGITVANNVFVNIGHDAIHIEDGSEDFAVIGNIIRDHRFNAGVNISGTRACKRGVISGNTVRHTNNVADKNGMKITGTLGNIHEDIRLSDCILDGALTGAFGLLLQYCTRITVMRSSYYNWNYGVYSDTTAQVVKIEDCYFTGSIVSGLEFRNNASGAVTALNNTYGTNTADMIDSSTNTLVEVVERGTGRPTGRKSKYRAGSRIFYGRGLQAALLPDIGWICITGGYDGVWAPFGRSYSNSTPTTGQWHVGDELCANNATSGQAGYRRCTLGGTAGTYSEGRTATTDGTTTVILSSASSVLVVGDYVTINATSVQILDKNGTTLTVSAAIPAGSGLAIAYRNPTFSTFGTLS